MAQKRSKYREMATKLAKGERPKDVLLDAGYSETQAAKGWAAVPDTVKNLLPAKGKHLINLGSIDPQAQEKLVRGRLVKNAIEGKDGGAMSAKILGSDKRLSMWQPEFQNGLVIIEVPNLPGLSHEDSMRELLNAPEET
jgi:phage terminase large subunit-like protein